MHMDDLKMSMDVILSANSTVSTRLTSQADGQVREARYSDSVTNSGIEILQIT